MLLNSQRGNAFFFILIGIALFAGLAYTVSRGMRSETTSNLTRQQAGLMASDLMSYGQALERAVARVRRKGVSENDISFEATGVAANGNCGDDTCKVFHPSGGNLAWQALPANLNLESSVDQRWQFSGRHEIPGIGTDGGTDANSDLIAFVEGIPAELCAELNRRITGSSDITVLNATIDPATGEPFAGTFGTVALTVSSGPAISGRNAFCVRNGAAGDYIFYNVLIAR